MTATWAHRIIDIEQREKTAGADCDGKLVNMLSFSWILLSAFRSFCFYLCFVRLTKHRSKMIPSRWSCKSSMRIRNSKTAVVVDETTNGSCNTFARGLWFFSCHCDGHLSAHFYHKIWLSSDWPSRSALWTVATSCILIAVLSQYRFQSREKNIRSFN